MPGRDTTGPQGKGQGSGLGMGDCNIGQTAEIIFAGVTEARVRDLEKVYGIDSYQK